MSKGGVQRQNTASSGDENHMEDSASSGTATSPKQEESSFLAALSVLPSIKDPKEKREFLQDLAANFRLVGINVNIQDALQRKDWNSAEAALRSAEGSLSQKELKPAQNFFKALNQQDIHRIKESDNFDAAFKEKAHEIAHHLDAISNAVIVEKYGDNPNTRLINVFSLPLLQEAAQAREKSLDFLNTFLFKINDEDALKAADHLREVIERALEKTQSAGDILARRIHSLAYLQKNSPIYSAAAHQSLDTAFNDLQKKSSEDALKLNQVKLVINKKIADDNDDESISGSDFDFEEWSNDDASSATSVDDDFPPPQAAFMKPPTLPPSPDFEKLTRAVDLNPKFMGILQELVKPHEIRESAVNAVFSKK
jgi:hypothetical protein